MNRFIEHPDYQRILHQMMEDDLIIDGASYFSEDKKAKYNAQFECDFPRMSQHSRRDQRAAQDGERVKNPSYIKDFHFYEDVVLEGMNAFADAFHAKNAAAQAYAKKHGIDDLFSEDNGGVAEGNALLACVSQQLMKALREEDVSDDQAMRLFGSIAVRALLVIRGDEEIHQENEGDGRPRIKPEWLQLPAEKQNPDFIINEIASYDRACQQSIGL